MPKFYCINCGREFSSVRALVSENCAKHPLGFCKGKHVLYEGEEKSVYICKYCGHQAKSIRMLVGEKCIKHPGGFGKGPHVPML